jgi:hypothetical protein
LPLVAVTPADFVALPYDDSLTQAGLEYARKSLHYTYNRMALGHAARLRNIVAGVAVELALVRHLQQTRTPFDRLGSTHFTRRDLYDLALAGRRVDLKTAVINQKAKITSLRRNPAWLLDAAALVPADQLESDALQEGDVYLFAFLAALEASGPAGARRALRAGQPVYLLKTFEGQGWQGARRWRSLGPLALKSNAAAPVEIEIGGQDREREPLVERLRLPPRQRTLARGDFYAVLYLHAPALPRAAIGIHSPVLKQTRLVAPGDWGNIWVYGLGIWLAGYLTKHDFRQQSQRLPPGSPVKQYDHTATENWAVPVRALRPVSELLRAAKRRA